MPVCLCIILSYIRREGRSGKKHFRNKIYFAKLSYFIFYFPASHVLSDIYVKCINVQGEKKLGSMAIRRTNKILGSEVQERKE
jgi:hypothetical protein